jgi:hypothetical protein
LVKRKKARIQKPEFRSQNSEARIQKPEFRSQNSEARIQNKNAYGKQQRMKN